MLRCPFCNHELEQFIFHEGSRDEPATVRYECVIHGDGDETERNENP